jgi:hypothetical protein
MDGSEKTRCCSLCISLLTAVSLIFALPKGVSSQVGGEVTFDAFLSWSSSFHVPRLTVCERVVLNGFEELKEHVPVP